MIQRFEHVFEWDPNLLKIERSDYGNEIVDVLWGNG